MTLVLVAVCTAVPALAQSIGLGTLTGTVTDVTNREPVPDVVVTVTSPALQNDRIVVTDGRGVYRVSQLPPGVLAVRLEKESYKPYSQGDIILRADRTVRLNAGLVSEAHPDEEVLVVGAAPTIDHGTTATGYAVSKEFVRNVPVSPPLGRGGAARTFETLAYVAPQSQPDLYGVSINGATSPENAYVLDGLSVSDPAFVILGAPLSSEFMQEVNVITGGYMPEYGRSTGGVLSATTKTGSNEFRGSAWGFWAPGALTGVPKEITVEGSALKFNQELFNQGDFGVELGGPIMKDKLWFYAAVAPNFERVKLTRSVHRLAIDSRTGRPSLDESGLTTTEPIPGTETSTFSDVRALHYLGKLTWALSPNHTVSFQISGTPTRGENRSSGSFLTGTVSSDTAGDPGATFLNTTNDSLSAVLRLNSSFLDGRLLVDTMLGAHTQSFSELPIDGSRPGATDGLAADPQQMLQRSQSATVDYHNVLEYLDASHPGYDAIASACDPSVPENTYFDGANLRTRCPVTGWRKGGPLFIREGDSRRIHGRLAGTYLFNLAGRHALKAGVDVEQMSYHSVRAYTGGFGATERPAGDGWNIDRNYGVLDGGNLNLRPTIEATVDSLSTGAFLQDSWTLMDRLTINAGLRFDTQSLNGNGGSEAFSLPSQLSPRVGAIYDFTGEGRSKIYANYAVYYSQVPLNLVDRSFGEQAQVFYRARNDRCSPTLPQPDGTWQANPNYDRKACGELSNQDPSTPISASTSRGIASSVDPDLQAMATNEIVAGGEYQLMFNGRVGLVYTHRSLLQAVETMSVDNGATYFIGNPGEGLAAEFPRATREYDAVTLFFDKSFADNWVLQASYTMSRLVGNYDGLFVSSTGQLDPHSNTTFDLASLMANQTGPLKADRTHQFKFFGAKQFVLNQKMAMTVGGAYTMQSGAPIDYLVAHPLYGAEQAFLIPRGSGGRTPWLHRIDARISYDYRLTETNTLSLLVDVFNLFNFQEVTQVDEQFSASTVNPVPNGTPADIEQQIKDGALRNEDTGQPFQPSSINQNFKNATAYQAPRQVRLGLRVSF